MAEPFDFLAAVRDGAELTTRDRRRVHISGVCADGCIHGEVQMFGPCRWRADGRYDDAPAGAAGPLDLVAPTDAISAEGPSRKTISMKEAVADGGRNFCCD